MNKQTKTFGVAIIAFAAFIIINSLSGTMLSGFRLDLTENNLYTLSDGTRNILRDLERPITLKYYFSEKEAGDIPSVNIYATRIRELLEEYSLIAGDNLSLEVIDPESFSEEEDQAVQFGLQGVSVSGSSQQFYFGLVAVDDSGKRETIPFFQLDRETFLEYDVTQLIYNMGEAKKPVVGLITSLPIAGGFSQSTFSMTEPWMILDQLRQQFEVRTIESDTKGIDEDIDILMVVHPKGLTESTLYAIDQFALYGGRVLAFVDPVAESETGNQQQQAPKPEGADFGKLLSTWGLDYNSSKIVGDLESAQRVRLGQMGQVIDYVIWMGLNKTRFNADDIVTNKLNVINVASAGALSAKKGATTSFLPLISSSSTSSLINAPEPFYPDPAGMLRNFSSAGKPFALAARVSGPVVTAYPDGAPPSEIAEGAEPEAKADPDTQKSKEHLSKSKQDINVIVMADTDFLQDRFWVKVTNFFGRRVPIPNASNADFVINSIDNLAGSSDLISVRSRADYSRPFTLIRELQRKAEQQYLAEEQQLQQKLQQAEQKINEIQTMRDDSASTTLTPEQETEIAQFRENQVNTRKELRAVQHNLRKDIENMERRFKFANIGLVPLLISIAGIAVGLWRRKRRRTLRS